MEQSELFRGHVSEFQNFFSNKIKAKDKGYRTVIEEIKKIAEGDLKVRLQLERGKRIYATKPSDQKIIASLDRVAGVVENDIVTVFRRINEEIEAFYSTKPRVSEGLGDKIVGYVNNAIGTIKDAFIDEFILHVRDFETAVRLVTSVYLPISNDTEASNKIDNNKYDKDGDELEFKDGQWRKKRYYILGHPYHSKEYHKRKAAERMPRRAKKYP